MVMGGASPKRGGWGEAIPSPLTQLLCPTHRQHHGGAGGSGGPVGAGEAGAARGTLLGAGWGVCVCANGIREGGPMPPWRFSEGHPPPSPYSPSHRALLGLLGVPASPVVPTCPGGGGETDQRHGVMVALGVGGGHNKVLPPHPIASPNGGGGVLPQVPRDQGVPPPTCPVGGEGGGFRETEGGPGMVSPARVGGDTTNWGGHRTGTHTYRFEDGGLALLALVAPDAAHSLGVADM